MTDKRSRREILADKLRYIARHVISPAATGAWRDIMDAADALELVPPEGPGDPVAWRYTHGDPEEPAGQATILYHMRAEFLVAHGWTETPLYEVKA